MECLRKQRDTAFTDAHKHEDQLAHSR